MGPLTAVTRGDVVLVRFPFSDLSAAKLRPAVVLADAGRGDAILAQVTSNPYADPLAVRLEAGDFWVGSLDRTSFARPGKLFTASGAIVARTAGRLTAGTTDRVVEAVIRLFREPPE